MLSEREMLIYMAGFFDGEGSIGVGRRKSHQHVLQVSVGQIDPTPLHLFKDRYGGSITMQRRSRQSSTHRDFHYWTTSSKKAGRALADLLPFLIVKRPQATLGLAIQDRMRHQGGNKGLPLGEQESREDLRRRISALNHAPHTDGEAELLWAELATSDYWRKLEAEMSSDDGEAE